MFLQLQISWQNTAIFIGLEKNVCRDDFYRHLKEISCILIVMKPNFLRQNTSANRIFAGLLAFWMSGAIFLLCCGALNVNAVEIEICPLSKKGHCAKSSSNVKPSLFNTIQPGETTFDCCEFFGKIFDKTRNIEPGQQVAEMPSILVIESPSFIFIKNRTIVLSNYTPPILSRADTYLKNRVFRI